jgi:hypothetical protein
MMASFLDYGAEYLKEEINERSKDLFKQKPGKPQLQVYRFFKALAPGQNPSLEVMQNQDVRGLSQIEDLKDV